MPRLCSIPGCYFPSYAKGLCTRHYRKQRDAPRTCLGCSKLRVIARRSDGLCASCCVERRGLACSTPGCPRPARVRPSQDGVSRCDPCATLYRASVEEPKVCVTCREPKGHKARGRCPACYGKTWKAERARRE